jgi:hypothetical protein
MMKIYSFAFNLLALIALNFINASAQLCPICHDGSYPHNEDVVIYLFPGYMPQVEYTCKELYDLGNHPGVIEERICSSLVTVAHHPCGCAADNDDDFVGHRKNSGESPSVTTTESPSPSMTESPSESPVSADTASLEESPSESPVSADTILEESPSESPVPADTLFLGESPVPTVPNSSTTSSSLSPGAGRRLPVVPIRPSFSRKSWSVISPVASPIESPTDVPNCSDWHSPLMVVLPLDLAEVEIKVENQKKLNGKLRGM